VSFDHQFVLSDIGGGKWKNELYKENRNDSITLTSFYLTKTAWTKIQGTQNGEKVFELLKSQDVYCLAAMIFLCVTNLYPSCEKAPRNEIPKIDKTVRFLQEQILENSSFFPKEGQKLLLDMLEDDPEKRPHIKEATIRWKDIFKKWTVSS